MSRQVNFMLSAGSEPGEIVDDLRDQIEALGHRFEVTRSRFLPPPWINVFSEGVPESHSDNAAKLNRAGYCLVVLASEMPTLVTPAGLVWNYCTSDTWLNRAADFVKAAPHFAGAWCYVPGAAKILRQFCRRTIQVDHGWGRRFDVHRPNPHPVNDFCFYGTSSPRRQAVFDALRQRGYSVDVIPHSSSLAARDARIPMSRVVLDVKQHDWWPIASYMRYVTALQAKRPVVAEARGPEARAGWENVARFAPEGRFVEAAVSTLRDWPGWAARQTAALKAKPETISGALRAIPETSQTGNVAAALPGPDFPAPILIESRGSINLVGWREAVFAIPQNLGPIHLDKIDLAHYPGIRQFADIPTAQREVTCNP